MRITRALALVTAAAWAGMAAWVGAVPSTARAVGAAVCSGSSCVTLSASESPSAGLVLLEYGVDVHGGTSSATLTVRASSGLDLDTASLTLDGTPLTSGVTTDADGLHVALPPSTTSSTHYLRITATPTATAAASEQVNGSVSFQGVDGGVPAVVSAHTLTVHPGIDLSLSQPRSIAPGRYESHVFPRGFVSDVEFGVDDDGMTDAPAGPTMTVHLTKGFELAPRGVHWNRIRITAPQLPCTRADQTWTCTMPKLAAGHHVYVYVFVHPLSTTPVGTHGRITVSVPADSDTSDNAIFQNVRTGAVARLRTAVDVERAVVGQPTTVTVRATNHGPDPVAHRSLLLGFAAHGGVRLHIDRADGGRVIDPVRGTVQFGLPRLRPGRTRTWILTITPLAARRHVTVSVDQQFDRRSFDPGCRGIGTCGRASTDVAFHRHRSTSP